MSTPNKEDKKPAEQDNNSAPQQQAPAPVKDQQRDAAPGAGQTQQPQKK